MSVCPSVCLSVCLSVTLWFPCDNFPNYKWRIQVFEKGGGGDCVVCEGAYSDCVGGGWGRGLPPSHGVEIFLNQKDVDPNLRAFMTLLFSNFVNQ